jgi:tetratricopeptide (TPR) repeat protein
MNVSVGMNANVTANASLPTASSASASSPVSKSKTMQSKPAHTDPLSQPIPLTTFRPAAPPSLSAPLQVTQSVPQPSTLHPQTNTTPNPNIHNNNTVPLPKSSSPFASASAASSSTIKPTPTTAQTPEQEVDSFLAGPSTRTQQQEEPGPLPLLKPTPFPPNLTGIRQLRALVERRAWSDVLKISAEMLMGGVSPYERYYSQLVNGTGTGTGTGTSTNENVQDDNNDETKFEIIQETIQIMHWRIRALLFLRRYHDLKTEILRLRLLPSASYNDTLPDWIPLTLILEGIEATFHVNMSSAGGDGKSNPGGGRNENDFTTARESLDAILDNLYELRKSHSDRIDRKEEGTYMHDLLKLDIVLVNILVRREEWRLALHALDGMFAYAEEAVRSWLRKDDNVRGHRSRKQSDTVSEDIDLEYLTKAVKMEVYSRQGKILLQSGALPAAATVFERAHDIFQTMDLNLHSQTLNTVKLTVHGNDFSLIRNMRTQILMNEGLLHFAHMDYDLAETKFKSAVECQRVFQREDGSEDHDHHRAGVYQGLSGDELMSSEGDLLIPCLNNLALCALYTCRMRDAINMMESLVREDPTKYLTEVMVFNLCTLYELASDNSTSERKKRVLQSIAKRFTLHDIGPENFRLN